MRASKEKMQNWADKLRHEECKKLIVELLDYCIDSEWVKFYDDNLAPYYDADGEPLVDGQKIHEEDE